MKGTDPGAGFFRVQQYFCHTWTSLDVKNKKKDINIFIKYMSVKTYWTGYAYIDNQYNKYHIPRQLGY